MGVLQANELTDRVVGAPEAPCDHPLQLSQVQGAVGQVWEGVGVHPSDLQVLGVEGWRSGPGAQRHLLSLSHRLLSSSGPSSLPLVLRTWARTPQQEGEEPRAVFSQDGSFPTERRVLRMPTRGQQSTKHSRCLMEACWAAAAPTWSVWEWLPFPPP